MISFSEAQSILEKQNIPNWKVKLAKGDPVRLHRLYHNRYLLIIKEEFIMGCKKGTGKKPVKK